MQTLLKLFKPKEKQKSRKEKKTKKITKKNKKIYKEEDRREAEAADGG